MRLEAIDWVIIAGFFVFSLAIGVWASRRAGSSMSEFFLSGRNMPWWILGISMVATTFSTSAPAAVSDFVRTKGGVSANWLWWPMILTGMLTVFVYSKLWRRIGVTTDIEFYELRYSGRSAAFLRGFRALFLGLVFNCLVMADVHLAGIKISGVMFDLTPLNTILIAGGVTVVYSALGGLLGVLVTDLFQFFMAMAGAIFAAYYAVNLPEVGGLQNMLSHPNVADKISILPDFDNMEILVPVFIMPFAVQWWSSWYPGAEPGGGGFVAQRMLAARDENHAMGATLLFNIAHYAIRPWPWILVCLASLIVFPDLASLQEAFPNFEPEKVKHDMAYPAMLSLLPAGLLGMVIASLIAAYMSTISTHLNWGSSYIVNDFYKRFVNPQASEKRFVFLGRVSTVVIMFLSSVLALSLSNAAQVFYLILQIGAGTGLLFLLRWFWWRINAATELAAMIISFLVAAFLHLFPGDLLDWEKLIIGVVVTTAGWIAVMFLTTPTDNEKLLSFYRLARPGGPGWKKIADLAQDSGEPFDDDGKAWQVPLGILCMISGSLLVFSTLFATGYWIYGYTLGAVITTVVAIVMALFLALSWGRMTTQE
jgi:SSS family solute:Na+ symporter